MNIPLRSRGLPDIGGLHLILILGLLVKKSFLLKLSSSGRKIKRELEHLVEVRPT